MKKTRKGFTLLELLIVIAIVGALAAVMSVSIARSKPTAKAKAVTIVSNVDACKSAAMLYYVDAMESNDASALTSAKFLSADYLPTWGDFTTGNIKYEITGDTPYDWTLKVDFTKDNDSKDITAALKAIKGYSSIGDNGNFSVVLLDGKVTAGNASAGA